MLKVKHERDCDCVVAGFRWHKKGERTLVGSLLLGLFDDAGALQHVGVCASFTDAKRKELVEFLEPYRKDALDESSVEGLGGAWRRERGRQAHAWRTKPLEPRQRFIVGAAAARIGGGGRLRSHARRSLPPHGAVPQMAHRTKSPATAPMRSSKLFLRRNWRQIFPQGDERGLAPGFLLRSFCSALATRVWDHHQDREFPAAAAALRGRDAG